MKTNDQAAYPFVYVEHANQMPGSDKALAVISQEKGLTLEGQVQDGWRFYLLEKVKLLQQTLKKRLSREIISK